MKGIILEENRLYTNAELAEWFHISAGTFKNTKKKRLEELEEYASFQKIKGKVLILQVYEAEYIPKRSWNKEIIHKEFFNAWSVTLIDTGRRASNKMFELFGDKLTITQETTYRYLLDEKTVRFGSAKKNTEGTDGHERKIWCTFNKETGEFEPLTPQQKIIFQELKDYYFSSVTTDELELAQLQLQGEFNKKELLEVQELLKKKKQSAFLAFKSALIEQLGADVCLATQLIIRKENN